MHGRRNQQTRPPRTMRILAASLGWLMACIAIGTEKAITVMICRALERYPEIWFDEEGSDASG